MKDDFPEIEPIAENEHAWVIEDGYPVSPGHILVIPKRKVVSIFELSAVELSDCWDLLAEQRNKIEADGFNVGVNDGEAAGQTIGRAHIHLIPRYFGDDPNPRGGVRGVIPANKSYNDRRNP